MANITTSIPLEYWNLAKEKHISWSHALIVGIKTLANLKMPASFGDTYHENPQKQIESQKNHIEILNEKIKAMEDANVDKKKES